MSGLALKNAPPDLVCANHHLRERTASERIRWALDNNLSQRLSEKDRPCTRCS